MHNGALLFKDTGVLTMMRDRILKELLSGKGDLKIEELKEKLSGLNLNSFFTFPAMILFEPSGSFTEADEKYKCAERVRDYLQLYVPKGSILFIDDDCRIAIMLSWVSKETIETIQLQLNDEFIFPINIGVGNPTVQLTDVHNSYHQALLALQNKFYRGKGQIIYYSELDSYGHLQDYPLAKEKDLYEFIKSADNSNEIEAAVHEFFQYILKNGPIDIKNMYELTIRLLVGMEKRVLNDAEKISAYMGYEIMSIVKMESLQEIKQYVSKYFTDLKEVISRDEQGSHRSIIKKTIHYMELECQHITLCSVAQKVYMTPTYLSLLFKTNTGKTFIEQLTNIRMDKAKDMLKSTSLRNYEVAEKVGYHDSRYFSQIFKKKVGVSPSEYRESAGK
ncbi:MAG: helix-turn-helix domain-containing protein [Paenibacillaceae bacterium]